MPSVARPPWPGNLAYRKREQAPCAELAEDEGYLRWLTTQTDRFMVNA
jgi:hypothetical protein